MATQSLYRRYRPRRFSEVKGQDHVVMALRNAVINSREGQAYLFSGPRGTGKTTSARILAKVLNCENPVDGEPCCACPSCLAVEAGTSYDVHELDAASNNGVDAMRDLIEKASLGTPGRHKVYILDEVHMLSKAAEAALLKTLEEPPSHVVFVLATTDPQKVSDTIRSRTQHLQFHLLPADELAAHVRWVADDAGITVSDAAIQAVLRQGGGSARDTLSALELAAATGGTVDEGTPLDEFVESLIESDTGRALAAIAHSVQQGRDPRTLTEDVVRHLRDCFLSLMAPELVQLPTERAEQVSEQARRLGAAATVKAMEVLGTMLVEMRHAPDPRLLVEVAFVRLTQPQLDNGLDGLVARIEKLERGIAAGGPGPAAVARPAAPAPAPVPIDPATGRARLGARAGRDTTGSIARPDAAAADAASTAADRGGAVAPTAAPSAPAADPAPAAPDRASAAGSGSPISASSPGAGPATSTETSSPGSTPTSGAPSGAATSDGAGPAAGAGAGPAVADRSPSGASPGVSPGASSSGALTPGAALARVESVWSESVLPALKPIVRALYSSMPLLGPRDGAFALGAPNDATRQRADKDRAAVEAAVAAAVGAPVKLVLVVEGAGSSAPAGRDSADPAPEPVDESTEIDMDELIDAPPEAVVSPLDRLTQAFPGSVLADGES
jgi:DNA polymerase-3 subunit gamma/tau